MGSTRPVRALALSTDLAPRLSQSAGSTHKPWPQVSRRFQSVKGARGRLHGGGSIALSPAVQYTGGVGGVAMGVTPCVISLVWYSGQVTSGGMVM
jgi:hypothetical protein